MTEKLVVHVTEKHIAEGEVGQCCSCPIALALNEQYPLRGPGLPRGSWSVSTVATRWVGNCLQVFVLPPVVQHFIQDFDRGGQPFPFTFAMERKGKTP